MPVQGAMGAISYVRGLRVLRIEDLHCRLEEEAVTDLRALTQVSLPATYTIEHTAIVYDETLSKLAPDCSSCHSVQLWANLFSQHVGHRFKSRSSQKEKSKESHQQGD